MMEVLMRVKRVIRMLRSGGARVTDGDVFGHGKGLNESVVRFVILN